MLTLWDNTFITVMFASVGGHQTESFLKISMSRIIDRVYYLSVAGAKRYQIFA